jgi:hypothetical protein
MFRGEDAAPTKIGGFMERTAMIANQFTAIGPAIPACPTIRHAVR